jgi:polyisoprenoid-binding protein YceI
MSTSQSTLTQIPTGVWQIDPSRSELGFSARGMFGLVPVHGNFRSFDGNLSSGRGGVHGELSIQASSLDTQNEKRDEHLRSADFFDVHTNPVVTFSLTGTEAAANGILSVAGILKIGGTELPLKAPVHVTLTDSGNLSLRTKLSVSRTAAGVGWSKMGMVQGKAHLHADLTLIQQQ